MPEGRLKLADRPKVRAFPSGRVRSLDDQIAAGAVAPKPRRTIDCQHDFKEEYYGWQCTKCKQFHAFGNAPWDDEDERDL